MTKSIEVSLADLTVKIAEDGIVVKTITDCSIGRPGHHTPTFAGLLSNDRERLHISHKYHAPMPYALFFEDGCAFHEGNTAVASHGCIHLNGPDASWLYTWAGHETVQLAVNGPYPASPVRV